MTDSIEVLITSEGSGQLCSASVWDPRTGAQLMSYKGGGVCGRHGLALVDQDYMLAAESTKPIINVWPINNSEPTHELRTISQGIVGALATSPDGRYVVAGIAEKIHLWQIESGRLLCVAARHFQPVTCLAFSSDGTHFVSGGEDGMVLVWCVSDLSSHDGARIEPVHSFSDHYLAVKDIFIGAQGARARISSVSFDGSCRVYDFASGKLLLSLVVDSANLTSICAGVLESSLFLGCVSGLILNISLREPPRNIEHHLSEEEKSNVYRGHTKAVTALSASNDAITLMSASVDETIRLWHIESKQCLKTIQFKGPVYNAFLTLIPTKMFAEKLKPSIVMNRLQRVNDASASLGFLIESGLTKEIEFNPSIGNFYEDSLKYDLSSDTNSASSEELALKCQEVEQLKRETLRLFRIASGKIMEECQNEDNSEIPSLIDINTAIKDVENKSLKVQTVPKVAKSSLKLQFSKPKRANKKKVK